MTGVDYFLKKKKGIQVQHDHYFYICQRLDATLIIRPTLTIPEPVKN